MREEGGEAVTDCISGIAECGWEPEQVFDCPLCCRTVCYCNGCHDDMPALCDDCWFELEPEETEP
jgi:hypothetical protein